mgnify:FL=1
MTKLQDSTQKTLKNIKKEGENTQTYEILLRI